MFRIVCDEGISVGSLKRYIDILRSGVKHDDQRDVTEFGRSFFESDLDLDTLTTIIESFYTILTLGRDQGPRLLTDIKMCHMYLVICARSGNLEYLNAYKQLHESAVNNTELPELKIADAPDDTIGHYNVSVKIINFIRTRVPLFDRLYVLNSLLTVANGMVLCAESEN